MISVSELKAIKEKNNNEYIDILTNKDKANNIYMDIAYNISKLSNCVSYKVGAIIVKDGRIISSGYNGTPAKFINCSDKFKNYTSEQRNKHHEFSLKCEIHAELNAILNAAKNGISTNNSVIYCTLLPCNDCLKAICNSGIKEIYYNKIYDKTVIDEDILNMLNTSNVKLIQL